MQEVGIIVAFGAGALSFLSPCVLPLLPGYLSMMSGYSVADLEAGNTSVARMFRVTLLFVAGFTVVFVAVGASATVLGGWLLRNQLLTTIIAGWVIIAFGILMVALAVSKSSSLSFLMRERRPDVKPSRLGSFAPPVMGVAFGFGWTPCIGPVLGVILTAAAASESLTQGMVLLLFFSLGLGVPFILAAIGLTKAFRVISFMRRYLRTINIGSGVALTAFGVVMVTGQINVISIWITNFMVWIGLDWLAVI